MTYMKQPKAPHYASQDLNDDKTNRDLDDPASTDIDQIAEDVFKGHTFTDEEEEQAKPKDGDIFPTDDETAFDQNSDDPEAGTPGHPGIDDDTA